MDTAATKQPSTATTAAPISLPTPMTSPPKAATLSHHINTLHKLDKVHVKLISLQNSLQHYLNELQEEETVLWKALEQSSTSLKKQREREIKRKEKEAVARLEEAWNVESSVEGGDDDDYE